MALQLGGHIKVIVITQDMFIENTTPYIGHLKFKFEKYPHYTCSKSLLNKVHLDLGFTKLVSRMYPYKTKDGWAINSRATKLITKYTGGKIGTHKFGKDGEHVLENSFVANDGTFIGDIETAWWYYKNKFYVCNEYPHGVAVKLKSYSPVIILKNYIKDDYENFITEQIENDNVEGYYGYTHRGGALFKIGDRLFDNYYLPTEGEYTKEEWKEWSSKFQKSLNGARESDMRYIYDEGIVSVIPFNKRGKKVIENWKEAREAAVTLSKYLS